MKQSRFEHWILLLVLALSAAWVSRAHRISVDGVTLGMSLAAIELAPRDSVDRGLTYPEFLNLRRPAERAILVDKHDQIGAICGESFLFDGKTLETGLPLTDVKQVLGEPQKLNSWRFGHTEVRVAVRDERVELYSIRDLDYVPNPWESEQREITVSGYAIGQSSTVIEPHIIGGCNGEGLLDHPSLTNFSDDTDNLIVSLTGKLATAEGVTIECGDSVAEVQQAFGKPHAEFLFVRDDLSLEVGALAWRFPNLTVRVLLEDEQVREFWVNEPGSQLFYTLSSIPENYWGEF